MIQVEEKKQKNIEQITYKAMGDLKETANPRDVDNDWMANFFSKCDSISDVEMQSLWAKILAGEANTPGTFSKRTVNSISSLDKVEANLFTVLCGFGWRLNTFTPLIYNLTDEIYQNNGINFSALTHLESIGLITFNDFTGYVRRNLPKKFQITYFGTPVDVELPDGAVQMDIGKVLFTQIGRELAPICGAVPIVGLVDYTKAHWQKQGLVV
jgi:hypothetical protein